MNSLLNVRQAALAVMVLILAGCSAATVRDDSPARREALYESRLERIETLGAWKLEGRLAVSNSSDGGSGSFRWQTEGLRTRMSFHGALGRGAWQLQAGSTGAELELADGGRYRAGTVGELVEQHLGWEVPVDALAWWVRGLAAPGETVTRTLDEQGRVSTLQQRDWLVEYGRYREVDGIEMPGKITARQGERMVKLAVRNWILGQDANRD